ncbi:hypothetical protein C8Q77DRAFT_1076715 [Trametes polyzona]|nr:hypothetical protein C8Q77DRAFT_1076715 [Trametes polyzona]
MPHRRALSGGTCEIVPVGDETACAQRAYGERPRLCPAHRREYSRLTAAYKAKSEDAEGLYKSVQAKDWTDPALWNMLDVEEAMETAQRCIAAFNQEIRARQEHHARFFVEQHDGHEAWIKKLRRKLREVEDTAAQLLRCRDALVQNQKLRAEEDRLAKERRARDAALRARNTGQRTAQLITSWSKAPSPSTVQCACGSHTMSVDPSAQSSRSVCVAYLSSATAHSGIRRCTETVHGPHELRCWQHKKEYSEIVGVLGKAERDRSRMQGSIRRIRCRASVYQRSDTTYNASEDISDLRRYIELTTTIEDLQEEVSKLRGVYTARQSVVDEFSPEDLEQLRLNLRAIQAQWLKPQRPTYSSSAYEPSSSESTGWLGTAIAAVVTGVAMFFAARR